MVDVHLVTGFLGAGKTSVLRHLLRSASAERVGIVVNDFGEAAIDRAILEATSGNLREIRGSCVCCTAPEGLVAEVASLLDCDRVFIEPTGLARPVDLWDTLRRAPYADKLRLGPLIVVVDPSLFAADGIPADLVAQLAHADVVIVNRIDLATDAARAALRTHLGDLWPGPLTVVETTHGAVDATVLAWPRGVRDHVGTSASHHHRHDHAHDSVFAAKSFVFPADTVFSRARLLEALATPGLVRVKGLFRTDEGHLDLQWAGGQRTEAQSDWRRDSRCDVIVDRKDAGALEVFDTAIQGALLDAEALARQAHLLEVAGPVGGKTFDRMALSALPGVVPDVGVLITGREGEAVPLREVLRAAGVGESGDLVVVALDGYTTPPTPLSELQDAYIVVGMDAGPLPPGKGGPFRLLAPGGGPCGNVKGVVRLARR